MFNKIFNSPNLSCNLLFLNKKIDDKDKTVDNKNKMSNIFTSSACIQPVAVFHKLPIQAETEEKIPAKNKNMLCLRCIMSNELQCKIKNIFFVVF